MFPLEGNATEQEKYVTSVVSASFAGHSINNLNDDVIITLKLNSTNSYNVTCVYWDFEANGKDTGSVPQSVSFENVDFLQPDVSRWTRKLDGRWMCACFLGKWRGHLCLQSSGQLCLSG